MGHPQQPTILLCDNTTAIGIAMDMDTIKQKQTKAIDMRFHWIRDRVRQQQFIITYISTHDNIADYFTKNLPFEIHSKFQPFIVQPAPLDDRQMDGSKGCVEN
jgi:hypothetical protein